MYLYFKIVFATFCFLILVKGESHFVCKQIDEVFNQVSTGTTPRNYSHNQGRAGKRGVKGQKGDVGPIGMAGPIDHDAIDATIKEYTANDKKDQELFNTEVNQKISNMEASMATMRNNIKGLCPIFYGNKCFIQVLGPTVNQADARKICIGMSGKLADIYSEAHFNLIMRTVRANHMGGKSYVYLWLGMTIDPTTGAVSLSNGESAPYLKWYSSSYPLKTSSSSSYSTYTGIYLQVLSSTTKSSQYMINYTPTYTVNTLCEI